MRKQPIRECSRCKATTKSGGHCKNRTCKSQLCWVHLKSQKGLRIKKSQFGEGLYAVKRIPANKKIGEYVGERLPRTQLDRLYPGDTAQYTICDNNRCVDGRKTNSSAVRYANSGRGTDKSNNARLRFHGGMFTLRSMSRPIPAGREILTNYGNEYRLT